MVGILFFGLFGLPLETDEFSFWLVGAKKQGLPGRGWDFLRRVLLLG